MWEVGGGGCEWCDVKNKAWSVNENCKLVKLVKYVRIFENLQNPFKILRILKTFLENSTISTSQIDINPSKFFEQMKT